MATYVEGPSALIGGWGGDDAESAPYNGVFIDGWFTAIPDQDDILERIIMLEDILRDYKPIFINTEGHLQEVDIDL